MTSFQETKTDADKATVETKEEPKAIIVPPISRVRSDPKLWEESYELVDMLSFCRPHQSKSEGKFIAKYLVPLKGDFDKFGNFYKQIGDNPTVLWSCHTDTVHGNGGRQKIEYYISNATGDCHFAVASGKARSDCLGADDTCGIWLMIKMIRANVPGLYIFHRGEEVGGKGSGWISKENKAALAGIKYAIAFDRRDVKSIITHQRSQRCCSDDFAESLAKQLGMDHILDDGGSFTDTANYTDLVGECTNISAGYYNAHSSNEHTNVDYLFRLRDALLNLDVSKLAEKRKPGEYERVSYSSCWTEYDWSGFKGTNYTRKPGGMTGFELRKKYNGGDWHHDYYYDSGTWMWYPIEHKKDLGVTKTQPDNGNKTDTKEDKYERRVTYNDMVRMIRLNPNIVADVLESLGVGPQELKNCLIRDYSKGNVIHL